VNRLTRLVMSSLLFCLLLSACAPAAPPEPTPTPDTGEISGSILDKDGKSLVGLLDDGWVALYCPERNPRTRCLDASYKEMDASELVASICRLGEDNSGKNCLLFYPIGGAARISPDGSYTLMDVPPGQYELVLLIVSSGIMLTVHLTDVGPVQAGQVTRFDFRTK